MRPSVPSRTEAVALLEQLLGDQPRRLAHSLAAGERCARVADVARIQPAARDLVVAAALLHDVGYAAPLRRTGFHPPDGAWFLREQGWGDVARLVAHHSQAKLQARLLALSLSEFPRWRGILQDLVDYADVHTGPDGRLVTPAVRLAEILQRYPPASSTARIVPRRRPLVAALVARVEQRCGVAPLSVRPGTGCEDSRASSAADTRAAALVRPRQGPGGTAP